MKRYKGYLIDLDGTMYRGSEKIEAAAPFVNALFDAGIPYLFVTNNSSKHPQYIVQTLQTHNIKAKESDIFTSSMATAAYIKEHHTQATCFVIGEDGLKQTLQHAGISQTNLTQTNTNATNSNPTNTSPINPSPANPTSTHVVVGIDRELTYEKIAQACLAIRSGATFIATNSDIAIPTERGFLPGNGAITAAIATSTGVDPVFIGKPSRIIMEQAIARLGVGRDVVMVGDNYETDIEAGIQAGIDTLLVCTGITKKSEIAKLPVQPTHVCNDLQEWL